MRLRAEGGEEGGDAVYDAEEVGVHDLGTRVCQTWGTVELIKYEKP